MSNLLHNKLFRLNLLRWFVLYIGVIFIFTTVVTYSKYITSIPSEHKARTAKFNVTITNDKICSSLSNLCNLEYYKPYAEIEYYFTVDTSELEVLSDLLVTINVNKEFRILSFTYLSDPNYEVTIPDVLTFPDSLSETLADDYELT